MITTQSAVERMRQEFIGKKLYVVLLIPGESVDGREGVRESHFEFVKELEHSGRLFMAGPFLNEQSDKPTGSGLFILRGGSRDEIDSIMQKDPYFLNGFRTYEINLWRMNEGYMAVNLNFSDKSLTLD